MDTFIKEEGLEVTFAYKDDNNIIYAIIQMDHGINLKKFLEAAERKKTSHRMKVSVSFQLRNSRL